MSTLVELTSQIVAAHAAKTPMTTDEIMAEISKVHTGLKQLESGLPIDAGAETKPAITIKEAFKKNEVICMICGRGGFKALARHLSTSHDMKPGAYKKQFGIPGKQALAAKSYSESRRKMAIERGLGDALAKKRGVRMASHSGKKTPLAKVSKPIAPVKVSKAAAPAAAKVAKAVTAAPVKVKKTSASAKVKK